VRDQVVKHEVRREDQSPEPRQASNIPVQAAVDGEQNAADGDLTAFARLRDHLGGHRPLGGKELLGKGDSVSDLRRPLPLVLACAHLKSMLG
jgi:hypothetical protein